jgi:predicted nicotinamide N-methyase
MITNRADFIRANTVLHPVPHAPEISLYVADEVTGLWQKTEEDLEKIGLPPPFWAFAWAGGQGLARYLLDHPALVSGKSVLDFASGSGLVAIAAKMAGALSVEAVDIDRFAIDAIRLNADANQVSIEARAADIVGQTGEWDVVLAGDVCYDRDMVALVLPWLKVLSASGKDVLIGDPGRAFLPKEDLEHLAEYRVATTKAIEDAEVKRTRVFRLVPAKTGTDFCAPP